MTGISMAYSFRTLRFNLLLFATAACAQAPNPLPPCAQRWHDFDRRSEAVPGLSGTLPGPASLTAESNLTYRVRKAQVTRSRAGRKQVWVNCRSGYLTGEAGVGLALPAPRGASSPEDRLRPIKAFLDEYSAIVGHDSRALDTATLKRDSVDRHNGVRTVIWSQELEGLPVFECSLVGHLSPKGELVSLCSSLCPDLRAAAAAGTPHYREASAHPPVSAAQALVAAAQEAAIHLAPADLQLQAPAKGVRQRHRFQVAGLPEPCEAALLWFPLDHARLRLCWEIELAGSEQGERFRVLIDAVNGTAVYGHDMMLHLTPVTYAVYSGGSPTPWPTGYATPATNQPPTVARSVLTLTAISTNASPHGWIEEGNNTTAGNNVIAGLGLTGRTDMFPDAGSSPTGTSFRTFNYPLDLTQDPSTYANASAVQLFYTCNWMHDQLYELGFTEASGNFQSSNFGRGGIGGDPFQISAQYARLSSDARTYVTEDGNSSNSIVIAVFREAPPYRDGALDSLLVMHEYTHGLSQRVVGDGSTTQLSNRQPGGMGEGWSDFFALALGYNPTNDPHACYVFTPYATYMQGGRQENYYFGFRRYPYSTDLLKAPLTFKDIDPAQADAHAGVPCNPNVHNTANGVHNMGEVWCSALWEARALLIARYGGVAGNQKMMQLVMDGMKQCPNEPTFTQARDAIMMADELDNQGADTNDLWAAFAKRGLGISAQAPDSSTASGIVEAFDVADDLVVSLNTSGNFTFSGLQGGPFTPAIQATYALSNRGPQWIHWSATTSTNWLHLDVTNGTLAPGAFVPVSVTVGTAQAGGLPTNTYAASLLFSNAESGITQARAAWLTVRPLTGVMAVNDSLTPADDRSLPFAPQQIGTTNWQWVAVTNTDSHYALVVSRLALRGVGTGTKKSLLPSGTPLRVLLATTDPSTRLSSGLGAFPDLAVTTLNVSAPGSTPTLAQLLAYDAVIVVSGLSFGDHVLMGDVLADYVDRGGVVVETACLFESESFYELQGRLVTDGYEPFRHGSQFSTSPLHLGSMDSRHACLQGVSALTSTVTTVLQPAAGALVVASWHTQTPLVAISADGVIGINIWASDYNSNWSAQTIPLFRNALRYGVANRAFRPTLPSLPLSIPPGGALQIPIAFAPSTMGPSSASLRITTPEASAQVSLTGRATTNALEITPSGALVASGPAGGPYSPLGQTYLLRNTGRTSMVWTGAANATWLTLTPGSGLLLPGQSCSVTGGLNATSATLSPGAYRTTLVFSNQSSGGTSETREASLYVTPHAILEASLAENPGWSLQGEWAYGIPSGAGGESYGNEDPNAGATGDAVLGVNLGGNYATNTAGPYYLTIGPLNGAGYTNLQLNFSRWLNTDCEPYADATLDLSTNGTLWYPLWSNGSVAAIADATWTTVAYPLPPAADRCTTLYFRWGYRLGYGAYAYSGWNLDDIALLGVPWAAAQPLCGCSFIIR